MANIRLPFYTIAFPMLIFFFNDNLVIDSKRLIGEDAQLVRNKGTVKTVKSEDGDIIDCVDIYKQPAFNHPRLKNHTIKNIKAVLKSDAKTKIERNKHLNISQIWKKNGQCPEGTIPIRRTRDSQNFKKSSKLTKHRAVTDDDCVNEYATVITDYGVFYKGQADLNLWNPQPEDMDYTLAQIWVYYDTALSPRESVEAGWHVYPNLYGDRFTRFFIYWTIDDHVSTGCYNLCPGFVQTSQNIVLGGSYSTSTYDGRQFSFRLSISKDTYGNWDLVMNDVEIIGYWPASILNNLALYANQVAWGGEIKDCNQLQHTSTPMGSGYFTEEGYGKAAFFSGLQVVDGHGNTQTPITLDLDVTNHECYDLELLNNGYFYYGGPGRSNECP